MELFIVIAWLVLWTMSLGLTAGFLRATKNIANNLSVDDRSKHDISLWWGRQVPFMSVIVTLCGTLSTLTLPGPGTVFYYLAMSFGSVIITCVVGLFLIRPAIRSEREHARKSREWMAGANNLD